MATLLTCKFKVASVTRADKLRRVQLQNVIEPNVKQKGDGMLLVSTSDAADFPTMDALEIGKVVNVTLAVD